MKKRGLICAMCVFSIVGSMLSPAAASAANVSVGGTVWAAQWEPLFFTAIQEALESGFGNKMHHSSDSVRGAVFGPVVSVKFTDALTWSNVFMIGSFSGEMLSTYSYEPVPGFTVDAGMKTSFDAVRMDFDSTANVSLNRYFKVFGGLKYLGYDYTLSMSSIPDTGTPTDENEIRNNGVGPGFGAAVSYPLADSLYLLGNASGMYLRARMTGDIEETNYDAFGGNGTLSLAYYFASSGITASLGGRYQYIKYISVEDRKGTGLDELEDAFYGAVLSVIWTF